MQSNLSKVGAAKYVVSTTFLISLLFSGCTETNNITNNIVNDTGVVAGRVISESESITVSIWLAAEVASTIADAEGYFRIDDVQPGAYEVRVNSTEGFYMKLENIIVEPAKVTSLGDIQLLNLVWPITRIFPADGSRDLRFVSNILFVSSKEINMSTFDSAVSITPAIAGTWYYYLDTNGSYNYYFNRDAGWKAGQEYVLQIDTNLKFVEDYVLSRGIVSKFTIEKFRVIEFGLYQSWQLSTEFDAENVSSGQFRIYFNDVVDPESLSAAISFSYPEQGFWVWDGSSYYSSGYWFLRSGPAPNLVPESHHYLSISSGLGLGNGCILERDTIFNFHINPLNALATPANGAINVSGTSNITIDFNAQMDTVSAESSFELSPEGGTPIPGTFSWIAGNKLVYNPAPTLASGQLYRITVSTAAKTATGHYLTKEYKSYFVVQ
jgi:hypothetical protein